jgi:hypothetical protein
MVRGIRGKEAPAVTAVCRPYPISYAITAGKYTPLNGATRKE